VLGAERDEVERFQGEPQAVFCVVATGSIEDLWGDQQIECQLEREVRRTRARRLLTLRIS
jgi:hypothetical protein